MQRRFPEECLLRHGIRLAAAGGCLLWGLALQPGLLVC